MPQQPAQTRHVLTAWFCLASVVLSWLLMQAVHEFGHVVHAWLGGSGVGRVVLHPLRISRTDVVTNPHPHFVAWGGFVWGTGIPLLPWTAARLRRLRWEPWLMFFAGFGLVANGVYFLTAVWYPVGDTHDLIALGEPRWLVATPGAVAATAGLWVWHRLDRRIRAAGPLAERLQVRDAMTVTALLAIVVVVELLLATGD